MTSEPTHSISTLKIKTLQTNESKEKPVIMATRFVNMMDNYIGWTPEELHEDAVMDWFGCCLRGRNSIAYFLRSHIPKTRHVIESVSTIPPVSHRLISNSKIARGVSKPSSQLLEEECGQGDCKGLSTPENATLPNPKELLKAPRIKRPCSSVNWEECEYLEIRGKLHFESEEPFQMNPDKKLERIILGYTDQIHLVIYETKNRCRKKLFA